MDNEELDNKENEKNTDIINEITEESDSTDQENENNVIEEQPTEEYCCSQKKKHSPCLIATGILATLSFIGVVVILCIMLFGKNTSNNSSTAKVVQTGDLKIAYINTDSIMAHYDYAKDLEKGLKAYQSSLESNYQAQGSKLKSDYDSYMKNGEKLTLTEQKRKEEDLTRRQQEFPALQQKMMAQLQERQLEDNKKLLNSVYAFIKDYNAKNQKFNIILSRSYVSSTVLYADDGFDITKEITNGLNEEYKEVKGK